MKLLDTNIILRWLLGDNPELSQESERLISTADRGDLLITNPVLAELFYVMRGKGYIREQIHEAFQVLLQWPAFCFESRIVVEHMTDLILKHNLDFVDCLLLAEARSNNYELITFDIDLQKAYKRLAAA